MDAATWLWARAEWRRGWVALGLLTLLIAVGGGISVAGAVAAQRTGTAFDRLLHETRAPNVSVFGLTDGGFADLDADGLDHIAELDGVLGATEVAFMGIAAEEFPNYFAIAFVAERGEAQRSVWVDGGVDDLMAMPADEIVINEAMRDRLGKGVGERLRLRSLSPEQLRASVSGDGDLGEPAGPTVDVRIVGIGRGVEDVADRPDPLLVLSPAFYAAHRVTIGNCRCLFTVNAEPARADAVARQLADVFPAASVEPAEDFAARISHTVTLQKRGWWLITLTAALAALAAVSQSCLRLARSLGEADDTQLALGRTRRERIVGRIVVMVPAVLVGVVGALFVAYALSPIAPIGLTRRAEPRPGLWWDASTLTIGLLAVAAASLVVVSLAAARGRRLAPASVRSGLRGGPLTSFGTRLALGPGRGGIVGVFAASAGLVGAMIFQASIDNLLVTPALYGADFDAGVFISDVGDRRATAAVVALDPDIEAVALWWTAAGGETNPVTIAAPSGRVGVEPSTFESVKGTVTTITTRGRLPARSDEVAVGRSVMEAVGVDVGDRIYATGPRGTVELTIVGDALDPSADVVGRGFALTFAGLSELVQPAITGVVVRAAPTADVRAVIDRHADLFMQAIPPPSEVGNIGELGGMPERIAQLLVLLGAAVVLNSAVVTLRTGRRELAIHRALGFTRPQVIGVHVVQGAIWALAGAVGGYLVGFVAGRALQRELLTNVGAIAETVVPTEVWFVAIGVLAVCLGAGGVAGWRAVQQRPAEALAAE